LCGFVFLLCKYFSCSGVPPDIAFYGTGKSFVALIEKIAP
jgi:hypothetical protein